MTSPWWRGGGGARSAGRWLGERERAAAAALFYVATVLAAFLRAASVCFTRASSGFDPGLPGRERQTAPFPAAGGEGREAAFAGRTGRAEKASARRLLRARQRWRRQAELWGLT